MGCDIHMITQIKKDGGWQYVPERPKSLEKMQSLDFFKGIKELEEIAKQYKIENYEDLRIVFAFDN